MYNEINDDFIHGDNFKIGNFNTIQSKVTVGNNVKVENYALLKSDTIIGNDCYVDSYVLTSGACRIGNNVQLRYQTIIARNVMVKNNCFFCAGVKTIYLNQSAKQSSTPLIIKSGNFFGDNVIVMSGITVAENCIFGAGAFVNKDTDPMGVYVGIPAKRIRDVKKEELWWK